MSYKTLTTPTMVIVSGAWLDPKHERPFIQSLPHAGGLLPVLDTAHQGLLDTQSLGAKADAALLVLQRKEDVADGIHDRKARGTYGLLGALAELTDDPEAAASYLSLRDHMFPHGLKVVQWSYTDEAGEAALVENRLTQTEKALLKSTPLPWGTLADEHEARIEAAADLGQLEKDKLALLASTGKQDATPGDVVRARNTWIRAVTAFVAVVEMEELSDEDRRRILGPLEDAERKADRRTARSEAEKPAEPPADKPAEG